MRHAMIVPQRLHSLFLSDQTNDEVLSIFLYKYVCLIFKHERLN